MSSDKPQPSKQHYSLEKSDIADRHQEIAEKCGEELIALGKKLQGKEPSAVKLGNSLIAHGEQIKKHMHSEAQQSEEALEQERSVAYRSQQIAARQRRLATEEHTQAVAEYNQYLQEQIEKNKEQLEQKNP